MRGRLVKAENGEPLAGAWVYAHPSGQDSFTAKFPDAVSDQKGRFSVASVPGLGFSLVVIAKGYVIDDAFEVEAPLPPEGIDLGYISVPATRTVTGRVQTPQGRPLSGAMVSVVIHPSVPILQTLTDRRGAFRLEGVPAEDLTLVCVTLSDLPEIDSFLDTTQDRHVVITVPLAAALEGRVTMRGTALRGATIAVHERDSDPGSYVSEWEPRTLASTRSDEQGRFQLPVVPAGIHDLRVTHPDATITLLRGFEVCPGVSEPLLLDLQPGREIRGRLSSEDGLLFTDAWVRATLPGTGRGYADFSVEGEVHLDGYFLIRGLPGGTVDVVAGALGRLEGRLRDVEAGGPFSELVLAPAMAIAGWAETESGSPVSGLRLKLTGQGLERKVRTDRRGRFRFDALGTGTYRLVVPPGEIYRETSVVAAGGELELRLPVREGCSLAGLVISPDGAAVNSGYGECTFKRVEPGEEKGRDWRVRGGRFFIPGLEPGKYVLSLRLNGFLPVELKMQAPGPPVHVPLDRGLTLRGRVIGATGRSVAGATVWADPPGMGENQRAETDENGCFVVTGLVPGSYTVDAQVWGYGEDEEEDDLRAAEVTVPAGTTDVRLRMSR